MNQQAQDLMMGAPAPVSDERLRELSVRVVLPPSEQKPGGGGGPPTRLAARPRRSVHGRRGDIGSAIGELSTGYPQRYPWVNVRNRTINQFVTFLFLT
jgi:hypothetical protein